MKKEKKNTAEKTAAEQSAQAAEPEKQQETKTAEQAAPQEEQAAPETEPDLQAAAKAAAEQMMEATGNEPLGRFVPEIAQLVLAEVTVLGAKKYEFFFLEGSRIKVSV